MTTEVQQVQATKRCNKCLEEKAVDLFALDRKSSDQRQWRCKVCQAAYHAENRSKILPRMAAYGRTYSRNTYIEIKADPEKYAKYLAENAIAKKRSIEKIQIASARGWRFATQSEPAKWKGPTIARSVELNANPRRITTVMKNHNGLMSDFCAIAAMTICTTNIPIYPNNFIHLN